MKHIKLIVIMILLVSLVASTAFAAGGAKKKAGNTETQLTQIGELQRAPLEKQRAISNAQLKELDVLAPPPEGSTYHFRAPKIAQSQLSGTIAAGTYTVGTGGTFATTLNAMAFKLNTNTILGPVVLEIKNGTYTEPGFYMAPIAGSGGANTVTIKPEALATVVINLTNNTTYGGGWTFAGTSNVIIDGSNTPGGTTRDMTIQYDPAQAYSGISSFNATINLTPGTDSLTIKNCIIKSMLDPTGAGGRYNITVQGDATSAANYIDVINNEMTQSARNIVIYTNLASSGPVTGSMGRYWNITGNYIHDVLDFGMYLSAIYSCNVTGNTITNVKTLVTEGSQRTAGIYMCGFYNLIKGNKISNVLNQKAAASSSSNVAFGIHNRFPVAFAAAEGLSGVFAGYNPNDPWLLGWAGYSTRNRFTQNTISEVRSNVTAANWRGVVGLACWGGRFDSVLHNTISFDGAAGAGGAMGLYFQGSGLHSFRLFSNNNIISMNRVTGNTNTPLFTWNVYDDYRFPSDYNVYYHPYGPVMDGGKPQANCANLYNDYGYATDGSSLDLNPHLMGGNDLHLDGTQPSAADNNGSWSTGAAGFYHLPNDLDGVAYGSLGAGTNPDIGAYEGSSTGVQEDAGLLSLDSPGPSGAPDGLLFSPITATAQNFGYTALTGVKVQVDIYDPLNVLVYTDFQTVNIPAFGSVSTDMGTGWTPSGPGAYTFKCYALYTGDVNAANDQVDYVIPVAGIKTLPYCSDFETPAAQDGWFGSGDWGIAQPSLGDTKLGGQHTPAGDYSYQTIPGPPGTHYTEVQLNDLYTPYFDLTTAGPDVYLSFYHSLELEPEWDRSIMQYSTNAGLTWKKLGGLNETSPPAYNWYSEAVYTNAAGANGTNCYDEADSPDPTLGEPGFWTSNGDCMGDDLPTGPVGFIFVQIKVPGDAIGQPFVRFKYQAWSDYTSFDGWAFDDFCLSEIPPVILTADLKGKLVIDGDGDMWPDIPGETPMNNVQVDIQYFGVHMAYVNTDVNGDYEYTMPLPGQYDALPAPAGYVVDYPMSGKQTVNYTGDGNDITGVNFAAYIGTVAGKKYSDLDDDGSNWETGEPGIAGFTIEVHSDSVTGPLLGSAVTDANGDYSLLMAPFYGKLILTEVAPTNYYRQTYPAVPGTYTFYMWGPSNGVNLTGRNFGNFKLSDIFCEVLQDRNGNGVKDLPDFAGLLGGVSKIYIDVFKNTVKIGTDTLSDGVASKQHRYLDKGTYAFKRMNAIPAGHIETAPASTNPPLLTDVLDEITIVINGPGQSLNASFLYFQLLTVSGVKYEDKAGNPGLTGWTINCSGSVYGSASDVTVAGGNYAIDSVGPGVHTISETIADPVNWLQTFPTAGTYSFTAVTASQGGNQASKNFGNFKRFCVSGIKFRDRDNDGVQDAGEEPLAGWTINLTGQTPIVTGVDGAFSWCLLGPGSYTLSENPMIDWTATTPVGGTITFSGISGFDQVVPFGNYKTTDNTKYRTFTYEQLRDCINPANNQKKLSAPKMTSPAKSPWYAIPLMTVVNQLMAPVAKGGQAAVLLVGERTKTYPWLKLAAWWEPAAYGDVVKTMGDCKLGLYHTGPNQPFNIYGTGIMSKRYKSIPPVKKNDKLIAELAVLQVNLALSDKGMTPAGLGSVRYPGTGPWGTDKSVDDIETYANAVMTNWAPGMIVPTPVNPSDYDALYTAVRAINVGFASTSVVDTTPDGGWRAPKFKYTPMKTAVEAGFLAGTAAPKSRPVGTPEVIPDVYALGQNYPNPFNPTTTLSFDLPSDAVVTLKIYNLLGQEVATVLDRQEYFAGTYGESFDASQLASGVYLYRIVAEQIGDDGSTGQSFTQVKKMVLMK